MSEEAGVDETVSRTLRIARLGSLGGGGDTIVFIITLESHHRVD